MSRGKNYRALKRLDFDELRRQPCLLFLHLHSFKQYGGQSGGELESHFSTGAVEDASGSNGQRCHRDTPRVGAANYRVQ
jgi:hypothetical protein